MKHGVLALFFLVAFSFRAPAEEILLHASTAITHGEKLRYEPQTNKNCLGFWTNPADWAEWKFNVERPGVFDLEVWQGCGRGNGGSDVRVDSAAQSFDFEVHDTGHFQNFIPRKLGRVHFWKAGEFTLSIKPQSKKAAAVMDIREVKLVRSPEYSFESPLGKQIAKSRRIVFLGDSITYSGEYIELFEAFIQNQYPWLDLDIINLGLPSETVSGLTEPGHAGGQFPRPDLNERLQRILEKTKPDLIFACYGMNDGIYQPFSEERFSKFRDGINRLRERATAAGAKIVHLTPPVFDPVPIKGKTPFESYNGVLDRYSEWLISQRDQGWEVIDIHSPMNLELAAQRENNPQFKFADDGIHPGREAHWLMTQELIDRAFGRITVRDSLDERPEILAMIQQRQRLRKDAWLTHVGHKRPGMNKGKPLNEAEAEAGGVAVKLASVTDRQFPGKRIFWNGFETCSFTFRDTQLRVVLPKYLDPNPAWFDGRKTNRPWKLVEELNDEALNAARLGYFVVVAPGPNALAVANDLAALHGLKNGEPGFTVPVENLKP